MKSRSLKKRFIKRSLAIVLAITFVFAFTPVVSAAQDDNVSFADANLKQAFLDAGADTSGDGQITQGELAALTGSVGFSSRDIEDLGGIAFATGITGIDFSDNNINNIGALTELSGLTGADVSNNYLDISDGSSDMADINALIAGGCSTTYTPQKDIPAYSISVSEDAQNMCVGDTFTLTAAVLPSNAANKAYTWSSSNTNVATVTGGVVTAVALGTAVITATSDDGGHQGSCTVKVVSTDISSSIYDISGGVLRYVPANTTTAQLLGSIDNDSDDLAVISGSSEFTGSAVGTGMKVRLTVGGEVRDEVTIVALGDVNGDGIISITDYTLTRLDILGLTDIIGLFMNAADIDGNGLVSISDYTLLRLHILNLKPINGHEPEPPEIDDPGPQELIDFALTQLGKPYVRGGKGPDSFDCSGFVYYCLNSIGFEIGYMTSTTWRSANYLTINNMNDIKKGDILCFGGHVGIYMGDGKMVDASSSNGMIVTRSNIFGSSYWTENFICAKRLF